jgi:metal-sulfur cluster biosynthetic enzyme
MDDDAPMFDNPAPIVYERAAASGADGDIEDDNNAATSLAAGARLPSSRAAALAALRRSAAAFECPGAWEAAFDPLVAGVGGSGAESKATSEKTTPTIPSARRQQRPKNNTRHGRDPIDAAEVFDLVRDIRDPEHPYTLEQLNVVSRSAVRADDAKGIARVDVTPTVDHCSMATLIGLCVKARLEEALPPRFKVRVRLAPGSHATEEAVNRQLADKERVAAAMENARLRAEVERCLAPPAGGG